MKRQHLGRTLANSLLIVAALIFGLRPVSAIAKIDSADSAETPLRYGPIVASRFRVGVTVRATRGAVQKIIAMVAIPLECAEQEVEMVEEDVSTHVAELEYRILQGDAAGGARQMLISIPYLPAGEEARAVITFDVRTRTILPPEETASLHVPAKPSRALKRYLVPSPYIESKHSKIRKTLKTILADLEAGQTADAKSTITDWDEVEAIYNFVQDTVEYVEGIDKSAVKTLRDKQGDCQNISALFVALCRARKIPARIVWVHNHNYAEFCLEDAAGKTHWFPCESSGTRAFGEMPLARTILQKGDNFKVPEVKGRLRYASDKLTGLPTPGGGKPKVRYIREQL